MKTFPFLTIFMIFILVTTFLRNRSTRSEHARVDEFWERENQANRARKVDLATISYYEFDGNHFPYVSSDDPELVQCEESIRSAGQKKMLNLNGLSNTDLKLKYGPQNLESLSLYDQNYTELETAIYQYGKLLYEKGYIDEAIPVLEKGIALPTDLASNFLLLAKIYQEKNAPERIEHLLPMAENYLNDFNRPRVVKSLTELQMQS